jgi:hypothetical protein
VEAATVTVVAGGLVLAEPPDLGAEPLAGLLQAGEPAEVQDGSAVAGVPLGGAEGRASDRWATSTAVPAFGRLADGRPLRAFLAAPARDANGVQRAMVVVGSTRAGAFGPAVTRRLAAMAAWLGPALDVRMRLSESGRVAEALQAPLLPPLPGRRRLQPGRRRLLRHVPDVGGPVAGGHR